jgi:PEP-CTERM motif
MKFSQKGGKMKKSLCSNKEGEYMKSHKLKILVVVFIMFFVPLNVFATPGLYSYVEVDAWWEESSIDDSGGFFYDSQSSTGASAVYAQGEAEVYEAMDFFVVSASATAWSDYSSFGVSGMTTVSDSTSIGLPTYTYIYEENLNDGVREANYFARAYASFTDTFRLDGPSGSDVQLSARFRLSGSLLGLADLYMGTVVNPNGDFVFDNNGIWYQGDSYETPKSYDDELVTLNFAAPVGENFEVKFYLATCAFYSGASADFLDTAVLDLDMPFVVPQEYNFTSVSGNTQTGPAPVPVPATMLLLGSGLVGLAGFRRKIRK